jgi:hypothetical protein
MACYRCGTRQVDPARGHSPWQRGVRSDQQVLICPTCQGMHDWKTDLDQCCRCGSVRLVRRLGETECRDCGFIAAPEATASPEVAVTPGGTVPEAAVVSGVAVAPGGVAAMTGARPGRDAGMPSLSGAAAPDLSSADAPGLSEEVERALDRVLGRGPVRG